MISLVYMHVCAHKIDNVEALVQSTFAHIRLVHDNLYKHPWMSVIYMTNLVRMYIDVYMNCKPMMMV